MTLKEYQDAAMTTATYPNEQARTYLKLGMLGESGEVCDKIKKLIRDEGWTDGKEIPADKREGLLLELGDVMWYVACWLKETAVNQENGEDECKELNEYFASVDNEKQIWKTTELAIKLVDNCSTLLMMKSGLAGMKMAELVIRVVALMATKTDSSLEEVCQKNIAKLASRKERNKIGGSGDYR